MVRFCGDTLLGGPEVEEEDSHGNEESPRHAVATIVMKGDDLAQYVHEYYSKVYYEDCYAQVISPINGQNKWPKTDFVEVLPPIYKRGPGRPKKLRRREPDEDRMENGKWQRGYTTNRCKKCLHYGHNQRTCINPAVVVPTQTSQTSATPAVVFHEQAPTTQKSMRSNLAVVLQQPTIQASQSSQSAVAPKKRGRPVGSGKKQSKGVPMPKKTKKIVELGSSSMTVNTSQPASAQAKTTANDVDMMLNGLKALPPNQLDEIIRPLNKGKRDDVEDIVAKE
ncbi:hypothetical protein MTR_6g022470 [Medicago truncatula]|uniref:Transcription factor interactor and regulator CCHC(Zn) family n=1 Tax=Medicago truncatula TaxID=3880 RepID=A0A072U8I4_MEDTR|nr:hypothetical protein MTR_6g022470 [Medicago truncatula]